MNIEQALQEARLDLRLRVEDVPHEWFRIAEIEATQLCAQPDPPLHFTFNCERTIQAYAVYASRMVVVTAGLLDFLCRLADRIVTSGMFPEIGSGAVPKWNPDPVFNARTARDLIEDQPFPPTAWSEESDRKPLFFYLLLTMFRFVVMHEIGHFFHGHGCRLKGVVAGMDVDSAQPRLLTEEEALDSQARELVADKFAMDMLKLALEDELGRIAETPFLAPLGEKLLNSPLKRVQFLLQAVYVYFAATDRLLRVAPEDAVRMSHPPAAFRLVTIASTVTESLEDENDRKGALAAAVVGDALIAIALNREPNPAWLTRMDDPSFSQHYRNLYPRFGAWTRT